MGVIPESNDLLLFSKLIWLLLLLLLHVPPPETESNVKSSTQYDPSENQPVTW